MAAVSQLKIARIPEGYCLKVEGSGTMRESRAAHEFVARCIADGGSSVAIDLSCCQYLDSTFLGCLVSLSRRFGRGAEANAPRMTIAGLSPFCRRAFTSSRMDTVLRFGDEPPVVSGEWITLPAQALDEAAQDEVARHVIDCHRQLADLGGPSHEAFRRVADAFERELQARTPAHA